MTFVRVVIVVFSIQCVCFGQSARDIARNAFKSVVLLQLNDANGQPISLGSGFFISEGIIATNAHVIEGASSGTAKLVGDAHTMQILGTVAVDQHADLALLKVESSAPSLALGPSANPSVGDNVYVVGNPLGLEGTFSEGGVSGVRHVDADTILQMTAPISPGSSGGPVMDGSGSVIGIAEATFSDGQNINLAVPVAYLSKLWASALPKIHANGKVFIVPVPESVIPLGRAAQGKRVGRSIVDGIGKRQESGILTSNFKFDIYSETYERHGSQIGYEFRLTNGLPVAISNIRVRIIYYDASNSVMDFEDFFTALTIPPGLTKILTEDPTDEAERAMNYYDVHGADGSVHRFPHYPEMKPKVELRVISFHTEESAGGPGQR